MDNGRNDSQQAIILSIDSMLAAAIGGVYWDRSCEARHRPERRSSQHHRCIGGRVDDVAGLGFNMVLEIYRRTPILGSEIRESRRVYSKTLEVTIASSVVLMIGLVVAAVTRQSKRLRSSSLFSS